MLYFFKHKKVFLMYFFKAFKIKIALINYNTIKFINFLKNNNYYQYKLKKKKYKKNSDNIC